MKHSLQTIIHWIGKLMLLGVILYFGIEGIFSPDTFASMIPSWFAFAPATILVIIHGVIMTIAAIFVFFNKGGRWAYYVLLLTLVGVLISVSGKTLACDIAIFGAVLVLLANTYQNKNA